MKKVAVAIAAASIIVVLIFLIVVFINRPPPPLTISFIGSKPAPPALGVEATEYDFNLTVTVSTSLNAPLGKNANTTAINNALRSLLEKYDLATSTYTDGNSTRTTAAWSAVFIVDGETTFNLYSTETFSDAQVDSLRNDLFDALTNAMNGKA